MQNKIFGNPTESRSIVKPFPSHLILLYPSYLQLAANKDTLNTVTCKKHVDFNLSSFLKSIFFCTLPKRPSFLEESAYEHIVTTQQPLQERYTLLWGSASPCSFWISWLAWMPGPWVSPLNTWYHTALYSYGTLGRACYERGYGLTVAAPNTPREDQTQQIHINMPQQSHKGNTRWPG